MRKIILAALAVFATSVLAAEQDAGTAAGRNLTPICVKDASGNCAVPGQDPAGGLLVGFDHPGKTWTCSLSGLAAVLTECKALAAGRTYYITDIVVGTTTATSGTYSIQSGTGTNCGTSTTAVFPAASTAARFNAPIAANPSAMITFATPLTVTAAHAVCVIGAATNTINIQINGYYSP